MYFSGILRRMSATVNSALKNIKNSKISNRPALLQEPRNYGSPPYCFKSQLCTLQQPRYSILEKSLNMFFPRSKLLSPAGLAKSTDIFNQQIRTELTLLEIHRRGPKIKKNRKKRPLDGQPQMKGVVIRLVVKKPKKPNSANRKCVLVRLSNKKEALAYIPGEGHNLQEHSVVLVRCGRLQDVPGVKLKVVRGKYDCAHVVKVTKN